MRPKIGLRATPKGGFGNRLLAFMVLRQLADRFRTPYFSTNSLDRQVIAGIHHPSLIPLRKGHYVRLAADDILSDGGLDVLRRHLEKGLSVALKPPLLGEALARVGHRPPSQLVRLKSKMCVNHRRELGSKALATFHLRGTDFAEWEPRAILGPEYYLRALDLIRSELPKNQLLRICTDDAHHPALLPLREKLEKVPLLLSSVRCTNPMVCDFVAMVESRFIVSSPSTFAITAGLLGKAEVVHSKNWVDFKATEGELFWSKIRENKLLGYSLRAVVEE